MKWNTVILVAVGATLGTVGAHSFFNGFDLTSTLAVALASFLGAAFIGYVSTLGKRK